MRPILLAIPFLLISCSSKNLNQAHYANVEDLKQLDKKTDVNAAAMSIKLTQGCETEKYPQATDRCIWQNGHFRTGRIRQEYRNIPDTLLNRFVSDSVTAYYNYVGADTLALQVGIEKIFLQTGHENGYDFTSCFTKFRYPGQGKGRTVEKVVKIENSHLDPYDVSIEYSPTQEKVMKLSIVENVTEYLTRIGAIKKQIAAAQE